MNKLYESTRSKNITSTASKAVLNGIANDGGLFVYRDLDKVNINIEELLKMDYYAIAKKVIGTMIDDFSEDEINNCVNAAYTNKFSNHEITPLVKVKNDYILELFHGPTSAFKDVALSILPHLVTTALKTNNISDDIVILTATSGDTGKAALEGFKDVPKTKIIVFYPRDGVSVVQEKQMVTQEGNNTCVVSIDGNFDDAQTGVKQIFTNNELKAKLAKENIQFSSANSINIGRLVPQMVYYFASYVNLVNTKQIKLGEKVNFIVPTGNFGDILAGYYAKLLGLPVNKLVCASNDNNVLYDFFKSGVYDRKRPFHKTMSPSMDILVSSNLERLLYYISGCDNSYIDSLMKDLKEKGSYKVSSSMKAIMDEQFYAGYCTNEETSEIIKRVYNESKYLLDPHTAVAYKVAEEFEASNASNGCKNVILATASPYKFSKNVYSALYGEDEANALGNEFDIMRELNKRTNVAIPTNLSSLESKEVLHNNTINREQMEEFVISKVK
ncbi:MAG: threonine synthase [Erysipelotrichaceae bacterium]